MNRLRQLQRLLLLPSQMLMRMDLYYYYLME
ncbi:hypothetical protein BLA29_014082 [Euroglyphus maynei]|uniref:Uncharacterized protein n=1 Tax=Euroglyphus maynei TaxID=6958 RepID=A0A1Y3BIX1_EURMA|nr:hypothetical protein BLA29_014082 [Euroglyphus maynei]